MTVADRLLLDVANRRRLGADITRSVVSVEREGSMESAPTLTVTVGDPSLLKSDVLLRPAQRKLGSAATFALRPIDVLLDGVWYRLKQGTDPDDGTGVLTFEHRGVMYMREHNWALSASRDATTRALFIRRQVDEVGRRRTAPHRMGFWAFEVRRRMPIAKSTEELDAKAEPDRDVMATLDRASSLKGLTVKGKKMDAEQRKNAAIVLEECENLGAGPKATLANILANIGEASLRSKPVNPTSKARGLYQLLPSTARDFGLDPSDVRGGTRQFQLHGFTAGKNGNRGAIPLARSMAGASAGTIASLVEGSDQGGAFYDAYRKEATAIIDAASGTSPGPGLGGTYVKPYRFRRDKGESGWDCTERLAEEVGRRRFVTIPARGSDVFVYSDDAHLLALPPQATFDPDSGSVTRFEYDLDYGRAMRSARATILLADGEHLAWGVPVMVGGVGAAAGKWLVWDVHESDESPGVEIELRQPTPAKPEPAPERLQRNEEDGSPTDEDSEGVGAVYSRAFAIDQKNYPYVWGGGHAHAGRPDGGTGRDPGTGYDCSGFVAACLLSGGMLPDEWKRGVPASGTFAREWGKPGEGERMTVWANAGHIFIEFKLKDKRGHYADTSRAAGGPNAKSGAHLRYGNRSTAGFTARHWPGEGDEHTHAPNRGPSDSSFHDSIREPGS